MQDLKKIPTEQLVDELVSRGSVNVLHEKKLERLFAFLCDSVERISEGKIAAPDETKILPDLIRILKHWDND